MKSLFKGNFQPLAPPTRNSFTCIAHCFAPLNVLSILGTTARKHFVNHFYQNSAGMWHIIIIWAHRGKWIVYPSSTFFLAILATSLTSSPSSSTVQVVALILLCRLISLCVPFNGKSANDMMTTGWDGDGTDRWIHSLDFTTSGRIY